MMFEYTGRPAGWYFVHLQPVPFSSVKLPAAGAECRILGESKETLPTVFGVCLSLQWGGEWLTHQPTAVFFLFCL